MWCRWLPNIRVFVLGCLIVILACSHTWIATHIVNWWAILVILGVTSILEVIFDLLRDAVMFEWLQSTEAVEIGRCWLLWCLPDSVHHMVQVVYRV